MGRAARDPSLFVGDRTIVASGNDLYRFGLPNGVRALNRPTFYRAAVLEGGAHRWRNLSESRITSLCGMWVPIGDLIVNPCPGGVDGGEIGNYGREYPAGGVFEPAAETWSALPAAPGDHGPRSGSIHTPGERLIALVGFVLDIERRTWTPLEEPTGSGEYGFVNTWVHDRLVVWGGTTGEQTVDDGAVWSP